MQYLTISLAAIGFGLTATIVFYFIIRMQILDRVHAKLDKGYPDPVLSGSTINDIMITCYLVCGVVALLMGVIQCTHEDSVMAHEVSIKKESIIKELKVEDIINYKSHNDDSETK